MRVSAVVGTLAAAASLPAALASVARPRAIQYRNATVVNGVHHVLDSDPALPHADDTTPYCSWWLDNYGSEVCEDVPDWWGISMDDFLRWNPSIKDDCSGFESGKSYCVEAVGEPKVTTTTTTAKPTITTAPTSTSTTTTATTTSGNGITTPQPIQPGMVDNCNKFYFVEAGDGCSAIASQEGITFADLLRWNPQIGSDCSGLWASVNVCVGVVGFTPTATVTTAAPTSTSGNGIPTPSPTQPGMVDDCDAFYLVASGDGCAAITQQFGISMDQFSTWNPQVGKDCSGLWLGYYVCVSVVGLEPTATTTTTAAPTTPTNGIATPTPSEPGMVDNCDAFHRVASGDTCQAITQQYGISQDQLAQWNAQVGRDCAGLWLDYYICVSVVGVEPTKTTATTAAPTTPTNGVATPTPTQAGMVGNCDTFHYVVSGDNCETIAKLAGVSTQTFIGWNPAVKSDCSGLWLDTYCCIGLI